MINQKRDLAEQKKYFFVDSMTRYRIQHLAFYTIKLFLAKKKYFWQQNILFFVKLIYYNISNKPDGEHPGEELLFMQHRTSFLDR